MNDNLILNNVIDIEYELAEQVSALMIHKNEYLYGFVTIKLILYLY